MPQKGELHGIFLNCEWCGKEIYRTQSQYKKREHHYCSNKCQSLAKHAATFEDRPCEICGRIMHVSKKSTQRFCSIECQHEWQKTRIGPLNKKFTRQAINCEYCGKEFFIKRYRVNNGQRHFCSKECRQAWYSNIWSQTNEWKETSRVRAAQQLQNNKNITLTKPQILINNLLENMHIRYTNEEPFIFYSVDNYLPEYDLIIEVMGDYWHANPIIYDQINDMQLKNINRDKAKHTFLQNIYGINVLYLWENDILHNIELCEKLIELYINNDGELLNYNSFNYYIDENDYIKIFKDQMYSYQETNYIDVKSLLKIAT